MGFGKSKGSPAGGNRTTVSDEKIRLLISIYKEVLPEFFVKDKDGSGFAQFLKEEYREYGTWNVEGNHIMFGVDSKSLSFAGRIYYTYGYSGADRLEQDLLDKINTRVQREVGHLYKD